MLLRPSEGLGLSRFLRSQLRRLGPGYPLGTTPGGHFHHSTSSAETQEATLESQELKLKPSGHFTCYKKRTFSLAKDS